MHTYLIANPSHVPSSGRPISALGGRTYVAGSGEAEHIDVRFHVGSMLRSRQAQLPPACIFNGNNCLRPKPVAQEFYIGPTFFIVCTVLYCTTCNIGGKYPILTDHLPCAIQRLVGKV